MSRPNAPLCEANSKRSGQRCKSFAVRGTNPPRCRHHAGKSLAKVRSEVAAREGAVAVLRRQGRADPVEDPLSVLAELAGDALAWRDACAELLGGLEEVRYRGKGGEQIRAEIALFERATDRAARIAEAMARLNIDDRLARIRGLQAQRVVRALETTLVALDASEEVRVAARHRLIAELSR